MAPTANPSTHAVQNTQTELLQFDLMRLMDIHRSTSEHRKCRRGMTSINRNHRGHSALQDGVRLQALNAKHTYNALLKWYTKKKPPILHQEVLDEAKDKIQDVTGLRPTNGKLLKSIRALKIPPRIKDHMRCMLTGKIKCGTSWSKIPGHTERAHCSFCKKKRNIEVIETEQHMWLECTNSGQAQAWETTGKIWRKSTEKDWPPT